MTNFVVYFSSDETIVTTKADEKKMLEIYFHEDSGRDLDEYEREVFKEVCLPLRPGKIQIF